MTPYPLVVILNEKFCLRGTIVAGVDVQKQVTLMDEALNENNYCGTAGGLDRCLLREHVSLPSSCSVMSSDVMPVLPILSFQIKYCLFLDIDMAIIGSAHSNIHGSFSLRPV
jgi:hypothetical protein